jgi:hypothetical protein
VTYRYITVFSDHFGVVRHQQTDDPTRVLAIRVAEGLMTPKQAEKAEVFEVSAVQLDAKALKDAIKFQRLVELARSNPDPIRTALLAKKMSQEELRVLREELQLRCDEEAFAEPWPFREERDEEPSL